MTTTTDEHKYFVVENRPEGRKWRAAAVHIIDPDESHKAIFEGEKFLCRMGEDAALEDIKRQAWTINPRYEPVVRKKLVKTFDHDAPVFCELCRKFYED